MNLSQDEQELLSHIDSLIPESGELVYDFTDPKQFAFALMMTEKSSCPEERPGVFAHLHALREKHIAEAGPVAEALGGANTMWSNMFQIPGLGMTAGSSAVIASNGFGTTIGGYSIMNLTLLVQDNTTKAVVASGAAADFNGDLLAVSSAPVGSGSTNKDVTSYLHYSYTPSSSLVGDVPELSSGSSGVTKRIANEGATADPTISAPVRTTSTPRNANAINIGLGRRWSDQGQGSQFDYAWNESTQSHPVGKIPFAGSVTFDSPIATPLALDTNLFLTIYVANVLGGGGTKLDAQDMANVAATFTINPSNPNQLMWSLPAGASTTDPGNPITFGSVTWPTDIEAFFYCGISVLLQSGDLAYASVQSDLSQDEDALDGDLHIMPIEFIWHCLAEETLVTMADGSTKPILEVIAGDKVRSTAACGESEVLWTTRGIHHGKSRSIKCVGKEAIIATDEHIFVSARGALKAREIEPGDLLTGPGGDVRVESVEVIDEPDRVYCNLGLSEHESVEIVAFVANGVYSGDTKAQKAAKAAQREDLEWMQAQLNPAFHPDFRSHIKGLK